MVCMRLSERFVGGFGANGYVLKKPDSCGRVIVEVLRREEFDDVDIGDIPAVGGHRVRRVGSTSSKDVKAKIAALERLIRSRGKGI